MGGSNGTDGKHHSPPDRRHSEHPYRALAAGRSELGALLPRMSELLALDDNIDRDPNTDTESQITLRLALIAMTEAEKRIERQEQRIKDLESLSITDELTHVMNLRRISMQMHKALALATRGEAMGSIIMVARPLQCGERHLHSWRRGCRASGRPRMSEESGPRD
jgi:hypothetical protein